MRNIKWRRNGLMVLFVLGCMVPPWGARGQVLELHPGHYRHQIFNEPVVLCTAGDYRFDQCDFMIQEQDTGLRIHFGSAVVVSGCTFMGWSERGNMKGVGVYTESTLLVMHSYFSGLRYGLLYAGASGPADTDGNPSNDDDIEMNQFENLDVGIRKYGAGKLSVVGNTFDNNATAIELGYSGSGPAVGTVDPVDIAFNFKCNSFFTNEAVNRTGLLIENGVRVNGTSGDIGGNAIYDPNLYTDPYPNANYFPIQAQTPAINRGVFPLDGNNNPVPDVQNSFWGWPDALNWKSINNQSAGNPVVYHRFLNEYLSKSTGVAGEVTPFNTSQKAYTAWNENQVPPTYDPLTDANACEVYSNFEPNEPVFPTRIAVDPTVTGVLRAEADAATLGLAFPNPASTQFTVSIYLPATTQQAVLQMVEAGSGKVLQSTVLKERGKLNAEISTAKAAAGSYRYRLVADGKLVGRGSMVVTH